MMLHFESSFISTETPQGDPQELRRPAEGRGDVHGRLLRAPTLHGQQSHLPHGGLRRQVHGHLQAIPRGEHWRPFVKSLIPTHQ